MDDLKEKYIKEVIPAMKQKLGYRNDLAVPKIEKAIVNVGIGSVLDDKKAQEVIIKDLTSITGQKPVPSLARKAIAGFKIRKGMKVGLKATLRGQRMYDFLSRLINVALPRTKDFRGLEPKSIDQNGNLTIGIKEHIIFPEVSSEDIKKVFGLEVTIVTNAEKREQALELFKLMGFPIKHG
jgi:large subunit ribosomal protein L5